MRFSAGSSDVCAAVLREVDEPAMAAKHPPLQVDDLAGVIGFRTELPDNGRIIAARYEADILAVGLGSHAQAMLLRQRSNLALFHPAERKPQIIELPRRGGEKKIALVARGEIGRAH